MIVQVVPLEWVNAAWPKVQAFIADALVYSGGEYSVDHAQAFVTGGQWQLLVAVDDTNTVHGAATIKYFNRPDARVGFITAIGGKLISNPDTFEQLKAALASNGATVMEGAARESVARLWTRYGVEEKYRIVGVKL